MPILYCSLFIHKAIVWMLSFILLIFIFDEKFVYDHGQRYKVYYMWFIWYQVDWCLLCIGSNFWQFYLIRTSFTLDEPVSLVKVFRLFRLEWNFWVDRVGRCTTYYLLAGPACLWCLALFVCNHALTLQIVGPLYHAFGTLERPRPKNMHVWF
jgi:hypothetical protein